MLKLKIITTGKCKEAWLQMAIDEYQKRLSPFLRVEWIEAKNEQALFALLLQEKKWIGLDPCGEQLNSLSFSKTLFQKFEREKSRLTLAIGGPNGFSQEMIARSSWTLSLSKLTFTHQVTRLVLLEQIYRALEIEKGSPYHKE